MNNLRKLRMENEWTQLHVQMQTGIDQALLSKYETGDRTPTVQSLLALADFFCTSMDYLMGRTTVRDPYPPIGPS